jgi:hypothetical protein
MTKTQALRNYAAATRLRHTTPAAAWKAAFPTRESLIAFTEDVGGFSWPDTYGDSPWDAAFSIGYELKHGLSQSSVEFYARHMTDPHVVGRLSLLQAYGYELPAELL